MFLAIATTQTAFLRNLTDIECNVWRKSHFPGILGKFQGGGVKQMDRTIVIVIHMLFLYLIIIDNYHTNVLMHPALIGGDLSKKYAIHIPKFQFYLKLPIIGDFWEFIDQYQ